MSVDVAVEVVPATPDRWDDAETVMGDTDVLDFDAAPVR